MSKGRFSGYYLFCIAHGRGRSWEAFCIDFDLAVQGRSYEEVKGQLEKAIHLYIQAAEAQHEPTRTQLLERSVPFRTRLLWAWRSAIWALFKKKRAQDPTLGFHVPCHA